MRYMIVLVSGFLLLAPTPSALIAQGSNAPGGPAITDSVMASYAARLDLSSEQEVALRSILETQSEKAREMMDAAQAQGRDAMRAMRPKMQELQDETNQQVEELLTEDQVPEYREIQAEIQERRRSMRQRRPSQ